MAATECSRPNSFFLLALNLEIMDNWTIFIALFCGIAIAQATFLGGYLLLKDRLKTPSILFLSIMLFSLGLRLSKSYFFYVFDNVPSWVVNLGATGLWAIGPALWLYTLTSKTVRPHPIQYLHFGPSVLILLSIPVLSISWVIRAYYMGSIIISLYLVASFWLYYQKDWPGNRSSFRLFFTSIVIIWASFMFQLYSPSIQLYTMGSVLVALVLYGINFLILNNQQLLKPNSAKAKAPDTRLQKDIAQRLGQLFQQQKIHLQKGLTLATVAEALDTPSYLISQTIRDQHGLKFNEFVNRFRVEEAKKRLSDLEDNPTIETIALEVGFSSTSSLYQAFKKEVTLTPQAYRKQYSQAMERE